MLPLTIKLWTVSLAERRLTADEGQSYWPDGAVLVGSLRGVRSNCFQRARGYRCPRPIWRV